MLKRIIFSLFLLSLAQGGLTKPYDQYKLTRWHDPLNRSPTNFSDFQKEGSSGGRFMIGEISLEGRPPFSRPTPKNGQAAILVNSALYPKITSTLGIYIDDLIADGYSVVLDTVRGGQATDLRDYLLEEWMTNGLVGAVFIGDLPLAWCKMQDSWGDWEEFPIDYYFMDLDGDWDDFNGDGMFDSHTGATQPEIWIGRLAGSHLTWGSEENLLKGYFTKNHRYRSEELSLPRQALAYDDDDWDYAGDAYLSLIYDTVTVVNDPLETTASAYRARLEQGYEFVHLMAHSSPWTHTFKPQGQGGTVYNYEINLLGPKAFFYNLFACSNARWVETDNIGSWYIFSSPYGLVAMGSTKTGSMLYFEDFYGPLGEGQSIGEAFKAWMTLHGEDSPSWFYGMTILGDPTLRPQGGSSGAITETNRTPLPPDSSWTQYRVTDSPFTDGDAALASDGNGTIYLVWASGRDIRSNLYESHFSAGTWSSPQSVCPHQYWDLYPHIVSEPTGRVWIAWHSLRSGGVQNIFTSFSDDGGTSWAEPIQVTDEPGYDVQPKLVIGSAGKPWVFFKSWRDGNANLYLSRYDNGWGVVEQVTNDPRDDVSPSATRDDEGRVWLGWASNREDNWDIYTRYVTQDSFSPLYRVTSHSGADLHPSIVCDNSGQLWIFWQSFRDGDANIYASLYDEESWAPPFVLTTDSSDDLSPSAAPLGSTGVIITWMSNRDQHWDIYKSQYEEGAWSQPALISANERDDISPAVCCSPQGDSWIAWGSNTESNWEIYASYHSPLTVPTGRLNPLPKQLSLSQNWPNPFNSTTAIRYQLSTRSYQLSSVSLKIYNIVGQEVRTLVDEEQPAGNYRVLWNGRDNSGETLSSGVYFCRLGVEGNRSKVARTRKMILLR